jgi:hypothetical protein
MSTPSVPTPIPVTLAQLRAAIEAPVTRVTSHVDIYEQDGTTAWLLEAPNVGAIVSVDSSRTERRTLDLTLNNAFREFDIYPKSFWYDKIIKPYRGLYLLDGRHWECQLGEFMIDSTEESSFPFTVKVTGRDYTKRLMLSKITAAETFSKGTDLDELIRSIAANAGIIKMKVPDTGKTLGRDFTYERGTARWDMIDDLAGAYNYDIFFDFEGYLVLSEFQDPVLTPVSYTFTVGRHTNAFEQEGPYDPVVIQHNTESWVKKTNDTRIYNHILVTGDSSDSSTPPVSAEAINDNPDSPTGVPELGDRLFEYNSSFITTTAQAQDTATKFLKLHALEEFEINLSTLVVPFLDAGQVISFIDPHIHPGDPTRFLLTSFSVPLNLGKMAPVGKRITVLT